MCFGCLLVVVWWFVFGLFWLCFLDFGGWVGLTLLVMLCFVCVVLRFGWFWFLRWSADFVFGLFSEVVGYGL